MNPILAWIAQAQPTQPAAQPTQSPGSLFLFPALLMAMVVFLFMTSRSQKKRERREREAMYARLSKNDHVLTIGGVIGTFAIPVPLFGSLIGASLGAAAGAWILELSIGRSMDSAVKVGVGAGVGRLGGTIAKLGLGVAIWLILAVAAFWP